MQFKVMINNAAFQVRKASPYIFFGVGVVSFGGAIAMAIRQTMKLEQILDAHNEEKNAITVTVDTDSDEDLRDQFVKEHKKAIRKLYFRTTGKIALLYAPVGALTALSIGSFTASAGILRGRYLMAAGALESVSEAFEKYRARVVEDAGEEKDLEYYYGLKKEKVTVEEEDPETGKTKKVKKDVLVGTPDGPFNYIFKKYDWRDRSGSTQWDTNPTFNYTYIMGQVAAAQNRLDAGERVYFDRLLSDLGFDPEDAYEHMAGWLPGDRIECGLEDENGMVIYDILRFKYGETPDVTLCFNPRVNVFADAEDQNAPTEVIELSEAEQAYIEHDKEAINE